MITRKIAAAFIIILATASCFDGFGSDPVPPPDGVVDLDPEADLDSEMDSGDIIIEEPGEAECGNGILEPGEQCDDGNFVDGDGCQGDCSFSCRGDGDCVDGNPCNGDETCNMETHGCELGTSLEDGTVCDEDPRSICLGGACGPSSCGDGYVDTGGGEECESGADVECITLCDTAGEGICADDCSLPTGWDCSDGSEEECNASDDNCNGLLDDGFACVHRSINSCLTSCSSSGEGACDFGCARYPGCFAVEICGNGVDDDCDGETDEPGCAGEDEWVCHNATLRDLGIMCSSTNCVVDDDVFTCDASYTDTDNGCNGECIYLDTGAGGYCGFLWASKKFVVPDGTAVLRFAYKSVSAIWGNRRGVAWEIEGRPETYSIVVECDTDDGSISCLGSDPGGENTTWTDHSVALNGLEGETIRVKVYLRDTSEEYCNAGNHDIGVFAKDFHFTAPRRSTAARAPTLPER